MLKLSADHIFHIGSQHLRSGLPCQDYALSGTVRDGAYAIVSDGCSTGGMTDVGSRIISLSIARAINGNMPVPLDQRTISLWRENYSEAASRRLGLDVADMLATCAYIVLTEDRGGLIHLFGDGVIAIETLDGRLSMERFDWANNMPAYPVYAQDNFSSFLKAHGGDLDAAACKSEQYIYSNAAAAGGWLPSLIERSFTLGDGINGFSFNFSPGEIKRLKYVAVFTDGVTQIDGVAWQIAVRELLAFKSTSGQFAKRRMNAFVRDEMRAGKGPLDDIAYAVIHIDHDDDPPTNDGEA